METKERIPTSSAAAAKSEFSINNLDDDSLGIIFNKLHYRDRLGIESVCKRWRDVSEANWCTYSKHLTITPGNNVSILEKILERQGLYLEEITVPWECNLCHYFKSGTIKRIVEYCPKLKRLNTVMHGMISAEDWFACSNLEELSLSFFSTCAVDLNELFFRNKRLRRLEIFNGFCNASDFDHLDPGQLEILHIISCPNLKFTAGLADKLAESLVDLNYQSCRLTHGLQHLSKLKNLRSLNLRIQCSRTKTQFIVGIAENCQKLEHITLHIFLDDVYNLNYIRLLFTLPCLKSLILILDKYEMPYEELDTLFREASNLKFLVLSSCADCSYESDNVNLCYRHLKSLIKNSKSVATHSNGAVIITKRSCSPQVEWTYIKRRPAVKGPT